MTPLNYAAEARSGLPALVRRAAQRLAHAETSAEILEARDRASAAYDMAKSAARIAKAKRAHDEVVSAVYRAQADALEIESLAKRRLADEYDAAQARGEVRGPRDRHSNSPTETKASLSDIGLTGKDIHEARQIRDAEEADPGIIRRALDSLIDAGEAPTKAALKREINARPQPRVNDDSLWLWGRLRDFDSKGIAQTDPTRLLAGMTDEMRADVTRLAPLVREFLEELEISCELT